MSETKAWVIVMILSGVSAIVNILLLLINLGVIQK